VCARRGGGGAPRAGPPAGGALAAADQDVRFHGRPSVRRPPAQVRCAPPPLPVNPVPGSPAAPPPARIRTPGDGGGAKRSLAAVLGRFTVHSSIRSQLTCLRRLEPRRSRLQASTLGRAHSLRPTLRTVGRSVSDRFPTVSSTRRVLPFRARRGVSRRYPALSGSMSYLSTIHDIAGRHRDVLLRGGGVNTYPQNPGFEPQHSKRIFAG
jgi:hypothetical protein